MGNASSGNNWQEGLSTLNQQIPASAPIPGARSPGDPEPKALTTPAISASPTPASAPPQPDGYPVQPVAPENPSVTVVDLTPPTANPGQPAELTSPGSGLPPATMPQPQASHTSIIVGIVIFIVIAGVIGMGAYFLFRVPPG